jgi:hypothetical protein
MEGSFSLKKDFFAVRIGCRAGGENKDPQT